MTARNPGARRTAARDPGGEKNAKGNLAFFTVTVRYFKVQQTFFFFSGKFQRVAAQFTPYSWTSYNWKATTSLKRWLAVCGIAAVVCPVLYSFISNFIDK